jgi:hypothetical protein
MKSYFHQSVVFVCSIIHPLKSTFGVYLFVLAGSALQAQNLVIQSTGDAGPTSGTKWSLSGGTLTVTGSASIRASVIESALASAPLTIVGNNSNFEITVNQAITVTTGGHSLVMGGSNNV